MTGKAKGLLLGVLIVLILAWGVIMLAVGMANESPLNADDAGMIATTCVMVGALVGGVIVRFAKTEEARAEK